MRAGERWRALASVGGRTQEYVEKRGGERRASSFLPLCPRRAPFPERRKSPFSLPERHWSWQRATRGTPALAGGYEVDAGETAFARRGWEGELTRDSLGVPRLGGALNFRKRSFSELQGPSRRWKTRTMRRVENSTGRFLSSRVGAAR
ncbi:hypothetical protein TGFOU_404080 [Toxoplasma gondii FOU]|uniref:Uncharacterized protein n=1 Tax=Toxoplasma gondii FOU TaxID=943167 RepID=A0A086JB03_TOXGO|nr:hypothetical protein TGFOU_404080 [Toxoplasma gondii FOU]